MYEYTDEIVEKGEQECTHCFHSEACEMWAKEIMSALHPETFKNKGKGCKHYVNEYDFDF